jgi:hypothetical protein
MNKETKSKVTGPKIIKEILSWQKVRQKQVRRADKTNVYHLLGINPNEFVKASEISAGKAILDGLDAGVIELKLRKQRKVG